MLEVSQGAEVQGRTITVDFVGDKSQRGKMGAAGKHQPVVWPLDSHHGTTAIKHHLVSCGSWLTNLVTCWILMPRY